MKIAILASNKLRIPPTPGYVPKGSSGAPEKIMYEITEGLIKRNHDVTLFASGDSETKAKLVSISEKSSILDSRVGVLNHTDFEYLLISKCYEMAKEGNFDIIHSIFDTRSAYFANLVSTPTISTLHSPLIEIRELVLSKIPNTQHYVSISNNQRLSLPSLNYVSTVYNGIDVASFPIGDGDGDYIIDVGRFVPNKGVDQVVSIAKKQNKKCFIFGDSPDKYKDYWNTSIAPFVDNENIKHMGFVSENELNDHYKNAKLFLFPIQWEEPFGLVMVEAMATGTPVVAYACGSVPEVVKDGVTGFVVNSSNEDIRGDFKIKKTGIEGLSEAVERIYSMPREEYIQMRKNCRKHAEENFTINKMIDGYEDAYKKILEQ